MEKLFLIRMIASGLKWLASITKNKVDDKIANTIYNIVVGSPELVGDLEVILRDGKAGYKSLRAKYKETKSKTSTTKLLYKLVSEAPRVEIQKVVALVQKELKKNAKNISK